MSIENEFSFIGRIIDEAQRAQVVLEALQAQHSSTRQALQDINGDLALDDLRHSLESLPEEISEQRIQLGQMRRRLAEAREELKLAEIYSVDEARRGDKINGSNQKLRDQQEAMHLDNDAEIKRQRQHVADMEADIDQADIDLQFLLDKFSAVRNIARVTAAQMTYLAAS